MSVIKLTDDVVVIRASPGYNELKLITHMAKGTTDKVYFEIGHSGSFALVSYTDLVLALRMITGVEDEDEN